LFFLFLFLDARFINDIFLLANIIPPKGRILSETNSGRKQWKFSTIESIEAIIVHCKVKFYHISILLFYYISILIFLYLLIY
jgi:hypothetical protein